MIIIIVSYINKFFNYQIDIINKDEHFEFPLKIKIYIILFLSRHLKIKNNHLLKKKYHILKKNIYIYLFIIYTQNDIKYEI